MVDFQITGRLVQGDPHKAQPPRKDDTTKQVKIDPKTGLPVAGRFFIAVAVEKNPAARTVVVPGLPTFEQTKAALDADARAAWPQFFGTPVAGVVIGPELPVGCTNPKFANKIIDGDGADDQGQPYSRLEGYAGCWVVKFDNGFAPVVHEWTDKGWVETVYTGRTVRPGDYVTVKGDCKSNQSATSPGMYMNFTGVAFEREGPAIATATTVDPNAAYGSRAGGPNGAAAANPPATAASTPSSPTASPGEPAPPPPSGPVMLPAAQGISYDAYKAKGWTDEQLRSNGYMQ